MYNYQQYYEDIKRACVTAVLNSAVLILMLEYTFVFAGVEAGKGSPPKEAGKWSPPKEEGKWSPPKEEGKWSPPKKEGKWSPPKEAGKWSPPKKWV
jgi:hypothetical protein